MIIPGQFSFNCPGGFREEAFPQKYRKHRIMYLVHHVKIINIGNYESFEIRRQSESDKYF